MGIFTSTATKGGARRRGTVVTHGDDESAIRAMEKRGEIGTRVRWVHHVHFRDEGSAREAARRVSASGWTIDWLSAQPEPFPGWVLRAGREAMVSRETAAHTRTYFERLAEDTGGSYQGWDVRQHGRHAKVMSPID